MCAGALVHCRLERVVFGASDIKGGAAGSAINLLQFPGLNHHCTITHGVRLDECRGLLKSFFQEQRAANKANPKPGVKTEELFPDNRTDSGEMPGLDQST